MNVAAHNLGACDWNRWKKILMSGSAKHWVRVRVDGYNVAKGAWSLSSRMREEDLSARRWQARTKASPPPPS